MVFSSDYNTGYRKSFYWTQDNRMQSYSSDYNQAFYRYDASGGRDLKLTGIPMEIWQNGQSRNVAVYD